MLELISRRLREVTVRPAVGADERIRWDALMGAHHYLPFRGLVGRSVRHVAVLGEHWLALVGWHAGAFKLRARDRWIGWLPEQRYVRDIRAAGRERLDSPAPHRVGCLRVDDANRSVRGFDRQGKRHPGKRVGPSPVVARVNLPVPVLSPLPGSQDFRLEPIPEGNCSPPCVRL